MKMVSLSLPLGVWMHWLWVRVMLVKMVQPLAMALRVR
jgi:hypothetical protein